MIPKFTGLCVCGHSWEDHHHGVVMNPAALGDKLYRMVDGLLGEECEATQFMGDFTPVRIVTHPDGSEEVRTYDKMCECSTYQDIGWENVE